MKKLVIIIASCLLVIGSSFGQEETLFNKSKVIGVFGGPLFDYGQFNKEFATSAGIGGGLMVNHFFIGAYGLGLSSGDVSFENEPERLELGHGGFWLGYSHKTNKMIHLYGSVKFGWGVYDLDFDNGDFSDDVFVVTPDLGVELNVFKWSKVALTASYRLVNGVSDQSTVSKDALNGLGVGLTFRIGWFRQKAYQKKEAESTPTPGI